MEVFLLVQIGFAFLAVFDECGLQDLHELQLLGLGHFLSVSPIRDEKAIVARFLHEVGSHFLTHFFKF